MKRIFSAAAILFTSIISAQNVGINSNGASPDASAMLDVNAAPSNDKGLLIPRIALLATNNALPITAPANSLVVYNTATAGISPNDVVPGFYYWNGTKWVAFGGNGGMDWSLTGNAGTVTGTNFLGTTDAVDLTLFTNNTEKVRITSAGDVGIGTTAPAAKVDIAGSIKITDGSEGAGKVLTSDANGLASWQTPSSTIPASAQATDNSGLSTTSSSWIDMTSMAVTLTTSGGNLLLSFTTQAAVASPSQTVGFRFTIDGTPVTVASLGNAMMQGPVSTTTYFQQNVAATWLATGVAAGSHTVKVQWRVTAGGTAVAPEPSSGEESDRTLVVVEIK